MHSCKQKLNHNITKFLIDITFTNKMSSNNPTDNPVGAEEPAPPPMVRRGAVSVSTPSEYEKLRARKNDKTGVLEYTEGVKEGEKEGVQADEANPASSKQ